MKALAVSLLIAGLVSPASPLWAQVEVETPRGATAATAPDPARDVLDLVHRLRSNDLVGLAQAVIPPAAYDGIRREYESHRNEPISDDDRAEFAEKLSRLTAPDAVDRLMTEIEPKLVETRPKAPSAIMMGLGAAQLALLSDDSELTPEQRETLRRALPGFQDWVTSTDFLSSSAMREALTLVTDAVRNSGIRDVEQLRAMSFEQTLAQAESVLAAAKQALLIYGLDVDAIADSLQVRVLENDGKTARVRTTVILFDAPVFVDHELVLIDGHWYGKDASGHWKFRHAGHAPG